MDTKKFLEKHWPRDGDSFLALGNQWETNALLHYLPDSFLAYAHGYKEAGEALVKHVEETGRDQDIIVYPVCYLYRHYLELMMKALINLGRTMFEDRPPGFPLHHRIAELWVECRSALERAYPESPRDDLETVEKCVEEFASMDPDGEGFRFPTKKDGKPSLSSAPRNLDLEVIRDVMGRISGLLEGSYDGMSEMLDLQREMQSMYAQEYW